MRLGAGCLKLPASNEVQVDPMATLIGNALYWTATVIATLAVALAGYEAFFGGRGDWMYIVGLLIAAAVCTWTFGRSCRYLLTRR